MFETPLFLATSPAMQRAWPIIAFYVFIIAFVYFALIRPQARRTREHKDLIESLNKGDRVVTAGGIHGTIVRTKDDVVQLDVGKGVILRVDRNAIRRRETDNE